MSVEVSVEEFEKLEVVKKGEGRRSRGRWSSKERMRKYLEWKKKRDEFRREMSDLRTMEELDELRGGVEKRESWKEIEKFKSRLFLKMIRMGKNVVIRKKRYERDVKGKNDLWYKRSYVIEEISYEDGDIEWEEV